MGCVGCSGRKKVTTNYMKPGGFRFWSRSLLLVHLVLVLPSHAVLLLCKWSSCCTSFSWCCLCVGRGCCWTCLTETGSKSERKSQAIANKRTRSMHHSDHSPCVVALGAFFSSCLVFLSRSCLPLGLSHPTSDLAARQSGSRARTTGSGNARPISIASSTDANGFHARTWLPARRPIPSARVRSIAALVGELRFRRQHAVLVVCRDGCKTPRALATTALLDRLWASRYTLTQ